MTSQDNKEVPFKPSSIYDYMTKSDEQIMDQLNEKDNNNQLIDDQQNLEESNTSLFKRMFSKMEAGSLRGSIFAMSSLALGTGCLALPQKFEQMSLIGALIVLILGSVAAYWSLVLMVKSSDKTKNFDYSKLVKEQLGKNYGLFLDTVILIYIFGILISYQCIIYRLIGLFIYGVCIDTKSYPDFFENFLPEFWDQAYMKYPMMIGICCVFLIPLCLLKDISRMRIASLFSICSLLYTIFVIIIESPMFLTHFLENHNVNEINWFNIGTGFTYKMYFFTGSATVFFAYTCHVGAFPVYRSLKNNVNRRINKVFRRSIILDAVIYVFVGITGYLTAPIGTPDLIIYRKSYFSNDIALIIGRLLIAVNLIFSTPANYNAFRLSFLETVGWDNVNISNKHNIIVTIPTLLITCIIGILYDKITDYISILGGFCSVIIAFLMPGVLYIKTNDKPLKSKENIMTAIIISILCTIGFIAGIMTIVKIINPEFK